MGHVPEASVHSGEAGEVAGEGARSRGSEAEPGLGSREHGRPLGSDPLV